MMPEYQVEVAPQHFAFVPVFPGRHPVRRFPADHPDSLVGEHERLDEREGLVAAPERARLLGRHLHREIADLGEIPWIAQPGLAVERAEEEHPVAALGYPGDRSEEH